MNPLYTDCEKLSQMMRNMPQYLKGTYSDGEWDYSNRFVNLNKDNRAYDTSCPIERNF